MSCPFPVLPGAPRIDSIGRSKPMDRADIVPSGGGAKAMWQNAKRRRYMVGVMLRYLSSNLCVRNEMRPGE